jgi:acyl carrier protein
MTRCVNRSGRGPFARRPYDARVSTTDRIREFIVAELGWRGAELTDDYPLLENRVIDSLGLFRIVGFLEQEHGVAIPDDKIVPANFASLQTIAALVENGA